MAVEAEDKGWMDKHYAEEEEKVWRKRELAWAAEAEARRRLMAEVAATRVMQMEDRKRVGDADAIREAEQLEVWRREQAATAERDRAAEEDRRRKMREMAEMTRVDVTARAAAREAEKQVRRRW